MEVKVSYVITTYEGYTVILASFLSTLTTVPLKLRYIKKMYHYY